MKRALVTGGSGTIGAAICKRLAADGCHVYVHANCNLAHAELVSAEITAAGGAARAVAFDVTSHAKTAGALQELLVDGAIQIVVNVTQPLLMPMIATRWGRIVNVSSVAALAGNRGQTNYAAAKAGLHGATKSLALELASRGITVNAIAPGIIASPMSEGAFSKTLIDQLVPMKRAGTPDEVADLAAYLASDRAGYISGQIISINGAMI